MKLAIYKHLKCVYLDHRFMTVIYGIRNFLNMEWCTGFDIGINGLFTLHANETGIDTENGTRSNGC